MNLALVDARDPDVERIWRSLEAFAQPTYFLSWGWISNWLAALPDGERPDLAALHDGREVVSAFFLAQRRVRRSLVLHKRALYFNATGSPRHDALGHGRNAMLTRPGARRSLATVLDLLPEDWDELHLPALERRAFDDVVATTSRYHVVVEREELAPYVDLATARAHATRGLAVEVARDLDQAMHIYEELLQLHRDTTFDDAWRDAFHRRLIADRLPHGEIQLVRVRSGGTTLGCLYNFVHGDRVTAYASGYAAHADAAPLAHAAAIAYNADAGHVRYHLLGAQRSVAPQLATDSERLAWLRIDRPLVELSSFEQAARRWYARFLGDGASTLVLT